MIALVCNAETSSNLFVNLDELALSIPTSSEWVVYIGGTTDEPIWAVARTGLLSDREEAQLGNARLVASVLRQCLAVNEIIVSPDLLPCTPISAESPSRVLSAKTTGVDFAQSYLAQLAQTCQSSPLRLLLQTPLEALTETSLAVRYVTEPLVLRIQTVDNDLALVVSLTNRLLQWRRIKDLDKTSTSPSIQRLSTRDVPSLTDESTVLEIERYWKDIILEPFQLDVRRVQFCRDLGCFRISFNSDVGLKSFGRIISGETLE